MGQYINGAKLIPHLMYLANIYRNTAYKKGFNETITIIYEKIVERNKILPKGDILIKEFNKKYFVEKQQDNHKSRVFYSAPT